jgi:hypothetical protein
MICPHEWYGPCDGFGPGGECSVCTGLLERADGSIIKSDGSEEIVKLPPFKTRARWAWNILRRGYIAGRQD